MTAMLRFQQQRKGRIAADVDPLDRVHLHGDVQGMDIGAAGWLPSLRNFGGRYTGVQRVASKALAICWAFWPGVTSITSKRMSRWASSGGGRAKARRRR